MINFESIQIYVYLLIVILYYFFHVVTSCKCSGMALETQNKIGSLIDEPFYFLSVTGVTCNTVTFQIMRFWYVRNPY